MMPLTTLDPVAALVLIDLQNGIVSRPTVHPVGAVVANARRLAEAFRRHRLPVVLVNVAGGAPGRTEQPRPAQAMAPDWAELVPGLRHPGDHTVTKRTWGAFTDTGLDALLKRLGATQVVLGGVSTSIGVESTARHAAELGYHVTLALDAMTDTVADAHANSVARIFPRLGETGATDDVIRLLDAAR